MESEPRWGCGRERSPGHIDAGLSASRSTSNATNLAVVVTRAV